MDAGDAGHILVSKSVAENLEQLGGWSKNLHDVDEIEVKHGVRLHVFNLYSDEFNARMSWSSSRPLRMVKTAIA